MSGMVRQKHFFWWSLHRDKNRWKEQHFAHTHLNTPGNWSRSVEQFRNENVGARRNPRMHRCFCGDWGVKEKIMDKSSTSPLGQFRDFLMRVCMSVSGPADVYLQMRRHYIRISGGRGLKGVPRAMPTLPYLTRSYLLFLRTICTLRVSMHSFNDVLPVVVLGRMEINSTWKEQKRKEMWILSQKRL